MLEEVELGLRDPVVSGIAIWQLTDIKADDAANRVRDCNARAHRVRVPPAHARRTRFGNALASVALDPW